MTSTLIRVYDKWVLENPLVALTLVGFVMFFFGTQTSKFKLDASAESLVLENDAALRYYRETLKVYGSNESLTLTFSPFENVFSENSLKALKALRDDLVQLERVQAVTTILDVPLLDSPKVKLSEIVGDVRTLENSGADRKLARQEFLESPIYKNMLLSPDGGITVLQVVFKRDDKYFSLLNARNDLREKKRTQGLTPQEKVLLTEKAQGFSEYHALAVDRARKEIDTIRTIMDKYRDRADLHLGGVSMIVADMISFIEHDLVTFGLGVVVFLVVSLFFFFRRIHWVGLPLTCCFISVFVMVGYLGFDDWRVTVISSNFASLLLILTISLTIHLIVRYRDFHAENPDVDQYTLVRQAVRDMFAPCFYNAATTIVAFSSLIFSGIRPVIDFGWMMTIGIAFAFSLNFLFFPAALVLLKPGKVSSVQDHTQKFTLGIAAFTQKFGGGIVLAALVFGLLSIWGISKLEVENRFINYFKNDTEIYQGMELIDKHLGGTTPLDIILEAPQKFYGYLEEQGSVGGEEIFKDPFAEGDGESSGDILEDSFEDSVTGYLDDIFMDPFEDEDSDKSEVADSENYWFNGDGLQTVERLHDYLDGLVEVGKVQSIATAAKLLKHLNDGKLPEDYDLAVIRKVLPERIKNALVSPFLSEDANQVRLTMRVIESEPTLKRKELIEKIRKFLLEDMKIEPATVHFTGMVVLYNNMLQSLYRSQIMTMGVVFASILLMFIIVFRNFFLACIAIVPSLLAACFVLGIMGWFHIPLDMMTITIAAITIGIAVDNSIHYVHRFKKEFNTDGDYRATLDRCHASIGKAIYYTSLVVTLGFSILTLSQFIPTIYFGFLTGLAMAVALVNNLTLLPILIVLFKPLGPPRSH